MDTKLKKFKINPIIKTIIILLTVTFAFLTGVDALNFARKTIYYGNENQKIQNTPVFVENVEEILSPLSWYSVNLDNFGMNSTFEDFCNNSEEAKSTNEHYDQQLKNALYYFNEIQEIKQCEPKPDGTYYDKNIDMFYDNNGNEYPNLDSFKYENNVNYNQNKVTTTTVVAVYSTNPQTNEQNNASELPFFETHAEWEYQYHNLRNKLFSIVYDARSEETIKKELEAARTANLKDKYSFYIEEFSYLEGKYKNVDFYIENPETGYYISNFSDKKDIEELKKNYKNNALFYFFSNGIEATFTPIEINLEGNFIYNNFRFLQADTELTNLVSNFDNCIVYIRVNQPLEVEDEFFVVNETFNTINNSGVFETSALKTRTLIFSLLTLIGIIAAAIITKPKFQNEKYKLSVLQRIPFVFSLIIYGLIIFGIGAGIVCVVYGDFMPGSFITYEELLFLECFELFPQMTGALFAIFALFTTLFINYIVVNKKSNNFKNRFFCYKIYKNFKKLYENNKGLGKTLKRIETKLLIIVSAWGIIELLLATLTISLFINGLELGAIFFLFIFIALIVLAVIFVLKFLGQTNTLSNAAQDIKNGNFDINLEPQKFVFPLREFAENLNECRNSIEIAVKEALKGEKLKTELITNVSHDLKTPLTSIINYVSLLKLCDIQGEDENKYLEILDDKSKKLQRLIEDLTEASKASSGNIKMNFDTVNLNELALQAVGESNDILENVGLEVIVSQKYTDVYVKADNKHTFRIFDNLFSNVKKYALPGTRVYVDVLKDEYYGIFSVKNISREKLNIDITEITERFVRGDNSRTTEGSGLGLSIARSFAELQNGIFDVQIDGDLFKVTVKLPLTEKPQISISNNSTTEN